MQYVVDKIEVIFGKGASYIIVGASLFCPSLNKLFKLGYNYVIASLMIWRKPYSIVDLFPSVQRKNTV